MTDSLDTIVTRAKEQLYRDEMLALMDKALRRISAAQARGAWCSTGTHESWKALEQAKEKLAKSNSP